MNNETDMKAKQPSIAMGWLFAPLAVLLSLAAIKIVGIDYDFTLNNMMPMIVVAIASMLAVVPRMVSDNTDFSATNISLVTLLVAFVGAEALHSFASVDALACLVFALVVVLGSSLHMKERYEWFVTLTFGAVGLWMALAAAGNAFSLLPTEFTMDDDRLVSTLNLSRQATAYVFFAYLTLFVILGLLVSVMTRGVLFASGKEGWFSYLGESDGFNRKAMPLMVALAVWALAFIGSIWHFNSVETFNQLGLTSMDGYHGYVGYWSSFLTGIVALVVAGMVAERWHTRAMLTGSMWALYLVSSWYEVGHWSAEELNNSWGAFIWLGITFFMCVAIFQISNHDKYGGWANRGEHDPSAARLFLRNHGAGMMIAMAFLIGLAIRIQHYSVPSMNALGTNQWDMTGGSDPWYMKRVVDYILANNAHLVYDADRFYPIGGINPRPPLFSWSMAIGAMILEPFVGETDAVWWSMLGLPAVYGALTIIPIAFIARDHFGNGAAVLAAWLIAFMPAHLTHSTWGLADHDSYVMLFISLGFMYWLRAVKFAGSSRITKDIKATPSSLLRAFRDVFTHRQTAVSNAVLAGVTFGIASLGWKGFVVGPSILFLAYALQVALNMFRRRDSTSLSVMFLTMMTVIFLMALPWYGHPQLDLVLNSTGLQPFLFIFGFTIAITFVTTGFRDKPWLLMLGTLAFAAVIFFALLYVLKIFELSNAWDVLFTGSGYFTKTKIFGTVAEANQVRNRGQLFASFGPITFVLALVIGASLLWKGLRSRDHTSLVFGVWLFAATFMAWRAARFIFNAAPIMAILGAVGIGALWKWANWEGVVRAWKKHGIRTPSDRFAGARKAVWRTPQFSAIFLVMVMLFSQQAAYGLDSAIPSNSQAEPELDKRIYDIVPDILRFDGLGFSILDSSAYTGNKYLGNFGSSFNDPGWNKAYEWLADQDTEDPYSQRPAFVSWWDYGFQALNTGAHPSVSDNFQSGIPATGNMLLARNQDDLTAMFIWQLAEGDREYNTLQGESIGFTLGFENIMSSYLTAQQMQEFTTMETQFDDKMVDYMTDRSFVVQKTNRNIVMAAGHDQTAGIFDFNNEIYRLYKDGEAILCTDDLSSECVGDDWGNESDANLTFTQNIRSGEETVSGATHYIFGEYWYTSDLIEEYLSVSTSIHRKNARLATVTQLLTNAMEANEDATIHDMYNSLIGMEAYYKVQDFEGAPGETISRDHEIRYFAIDDRLYPRAGRYTADQNYNRGQPMGIFQAPTILSGQDVSTYMDEVYETIRGEFSDEMTREEVDEAIQKDFLNQQAGAEIDPLQVEDVRVDHNPAFFDTMVARAYVGYGASTLGLDTAGSNPQPSQHFGVSGTPGSILANAYPLPGAMMNHFVIANWYDTDESIGITSNPSITSVKILKYYAGAELTGQVTMGDNGEGLPGVRLLIERDAFSGEDSEDLDADTYWAPIGFVDADENGHYSYTVPAGRIRVSAFAGDYDPTLARDQIRDGSYAQSLGDLLTSDSEDRQVNQLTAILGQVANMTWLGDAELNVTGAQGNREATIDSPLDLPIESSGVSGTVAWSGDEMFNGDPISETTFILRNIWSMTDNYSVVTTSGSFTSEESRILQGTGQATFSENGTFESDGMAIARDFIGDFVRDIGNDRKYFGNGTWAGVGSIEASWIEPTDVASCEFDNDSVAIMPDNETVCLSDDTGVLSVYKLEGSVNATGTFTSVGTSTLTRSYGDFDAGIGSTIEGAGSFSGIGTFNGTGLFIGAGEFSGPMVEPGSFYKTGLLPGTYNMIAQLDNGKEVLLPDPVEIGITPSYDLDMTLPAAVFRDVLKDMDDELLPNQTIELIDLALGEENMILIETDENASFSHGPMPKGDYYLRIDLDQDGWYDMNESIIVNDDTNNVTLPYGVPATVDVTLNLVSPVDPLTQEPLFEVANRLITFANTAGMLDPVNATSDENGTVYVELLYGVYDIRDDINPEFVMFDQIELDFGSEDMTRNVTYAQAVYLNGTIRAYQGDMNDYETWLEETPEENLIETSAPASGTAVTFRSGVLNFEEVTNTSGFYSVRVPSGFDYHMTTESGFGSMVGGQLVTASETGEMDLGTMYLEPASIVSGVIYLYDNSTRWDNNIPRWVEPEILAVNEEGLEWRTTASEIGEFNLNLFDGVWDISVIDERLNITGFDDVIVNDTLTDELSLLEFTANPSSIDVTLWVFINSAEDATFENGTKVSPDLYLEPADDNREPIYFTSDDYSSLGVLDVALTPGSYALKFNRTTAESENATDYDLIGEIFFEDIYIALDGPEEPLPVPLRETYLVTGVLENSTQDGIMNEFLLYNESTDTWFNMGSDENGSFAAYVPAGEWLIIVAPYTNNEVMETLRTTLTVSENASARSNLSLETVASVEVSFQLKEELTENPLMDMNVIAISNDGYGNVTFGNTNADGNTSKMLMPGSWSLYMNRSIGTQTWMLNGSDNPFNAANSTLDLGVVYAALEVQIGGKVYWDLDNNSVPDSSEGIPDVNVTIIGNSTAVNTTVVTDSEGVWRVFVPIRDVYNVTVEKEGFETVYYATENQSGYTVLDSPDSTDIKVVAGAVQASGSITDSVDSSRLEGASITLYPRAGVAREPISMVGVLNNGSLEWDAMIQPGDWIVIVADANPDENGGGVAIGLLDASVANGGEVNMTMTRAGFVHLSTEWMDITAGLHHVGSDDDGYDAITAPVEIEVTFDGMTWMMPMPADGVLSLLMPQGNVAFDSEFTTIQTADDLEMVYFGGQSVTITNDETLDLKLDYNRRVNSDVIQTFVVESLGTSAELINAESIEFMAKVSPTNESVYQVIDFDVDVTYNGTEAEDIFTVTAEMGLAQDSDLWVVEVLNSSSGEYEEMTMLTLGIGAANSNETVDRTATLSVRVTLPSVEDAWHLDDGHRITIRMVTELGESSQFTMKVVVPQNHGFSIAEATEVLGISPLVQRQFSFEVTNEGNGRDTFRIEVLESPIPMNWSVTPMDSNLTLAKGETRNQPFTVFAPAEFVEGSILLTVDITSVSGTQSEQVKVTIKAARIALEVETGDIQTESDDVAGEPGRVIIPVSNNGELDANDVIVYLTLPNGTEMQQTVSVPANSQTFAVFEDIEQNQGNQRFELRVEVAGEDAPYVESNVYESDWSLEYRVVSSGEGDSPWLSVLILVLIVLVAYGGVRTARSRGGTKF